MSLRHGLTGSTTPLFFRCSWWARADVYSTLPARKNTADSRYGLAFHDLAEGEEARDEDAPSSEDQAEALNDLLDEALDDLVGVIGRSGDMGRIGEVCQRWGLTDEQPLMQMSSL